MGRLTVEEIRAEIADECPDPMLLNIDSCTVLVEHIAELEAENEAQKLELAGPPRQRLAYVKQLQEQRDALRAAVAGVRDTLSRVSLRKRIAELEAERDDYKGRHERVALRLIHADADLGLMTEQRDALRAALVKIREEMNDSGCWATASGIIDAALKQAGGE